MPGSRPSCIRAVAAPILLPNKAIVDTTLVARECTMMHIKSSLSLVITEWDVFSIWLSWTSEIKGKNSKTFYLRALGIPVVPSESMKVSFADLSHRHLNFSFYNYSQKFALNYGRLFVLSSPCDILLSFRHWTSLTLLCPNCFWVIHPRVRSSRTPTCVWAGGLGLLFQSSYFCLRLHRQPPPSPTASVQEQISDTPTDCCVYTRCHGVATGVGIVNIIGRIPHNCVNLQLGNNDSVDNYYKSSNKNGVRSTGIINRSISIAVSWQQQQLLPSMTQVEELLGFVGIFLEFDGLENVEVGLGWNLTKGLGMIRYT